MEFIDQSARALVLKVFKGQPDLGQFNIFCAGSVVLPWLEVNAYVIGASHLVIFSAGEFKFCEVFSCSPVETKATLLLDSSIDKLHRPEILKLQHLDYSFDAWSMPLDKGAVELEEIKKKIVSSKPPNSLGLRFDFPAESDKVPQTLVSLKIEGQEVVVNTAHSYPNESEVVFTKTKITNFNVKGD